MLAAREPWILWGILALGLLLRLSGIAFGLPFHVFNDEDPNVNAGLLLVQFHTLIPAFHAVAFKSILYEAPLLSQLYAILFTPFVLLHASNSWIWIAARAFDAVVSTATAYLVYVIARRFFPLRTALASAAFFATSFISITVSSTARHWTLGTFFSVLALYGVIKAFDSKHRLAWLAATGATLGLAFGASYLIYYVPLIGTYVLYRFHQEYPQGSLADKAFLKAFAVLAGAYLIVATIFYFVYPSSFLGDVAYVTSRGDKSFLGFFVFYLQTLFNLETPLFIFAVIGAWFVRRRSVILAPAALLFILMAYLFLADAIRFVIPLLPLLALLAGYGFDQFRMRVPGKVFMAITLLLAGYFLALYGRYELLMVRNDTRAAFFSWAHANLPSGSELIIATDSIDQHFFTGQKFSVITIASGTAFPAEKQAAIARALAASSTSKYVVKGSWGAGTQQKLFIGGDYNGSGKQLLQLLYGIPQLGPDITVYALA